MQIVVGRHRPTTRWEVVVWIALLFLVFRGAAAFALPFMLATYNRPPRKA